MIHSGDLQTNLDLNNGVSAVVEDKPIKTIKPVSAPAKSKKK